MTPEHIVNCEACDMLHAYNEPSCPDVGARAYLEELERHRYNPWRDPLWEGRNPWS